MKYPKHKICGGWIIFPFKKEKKEEVGYCLNCQEIVDNPKQILNLGE
jgi:hypothetical protein